MAKVTQKSYLKPVGRERHADNYLTKRILERSARAGVRAASHNTMMTMGFTIIAHNGWIIRKYSDGRIVQIVKIQPAPSSSNAKIKLD